MKSIFYISIKPFKTFSMSEIITINFAFLEDIYYFLARYKIKDDLREYYITVMDGDLEKLLYGNHVIREQNGYLQIEIFENSEQERLKVKIAEALSDFLKVPLTRIENFVSKEIA